MHAETESEDVLLGQLTLLPNKGEPSYLVA